MRAYIQGDFHNSERDLNQLLDQVSEDTDCVFIEGQGDTVFFSDVTRPYSIYIIGIFQYLAIWGRKANSPVKERLDEKGIEYDDEIDKELAEDFSDFPIWGHLIVLSIFPGYLWIYLQYSSNLIIKIGPFIANFFAINVFLLALFSPLLYYTFMTIIEGVLIQGRDRTMANSIMEKAESENHDEISIFVGQVHVSGIKEVLEANGWDVTTNPTWLHPKRLVSK